MANVNVPAGYSEIVCISCTNDALGYTYETITLDNYKITQTADPCSTALNNLSPAPLTFAYASTGTQAVGNWATFV